MHINLLSLTSVKPHIACARLNWYSAHDFSYFSFMYLCFWCPSLSIKWNSHSFVHSSLAHLTQTAVYIIHLRFCVSAELCANAIEQLGEMDLYEFARAKYIPDMDICYTWRGWWWRRKRRFAHTQTHTHALEISSTFICAACQPYIINETITHDTHNSSKSI